LGRGEGGSGIVFGVVLIICRKKDDTQSDSEI
jgi:hypothetical protein